MLYVFLVDTGTMMSFDMNLALESVSKLKEAIARVHKIPEDKQVLLISGGDNLDPDARVCSYSAGTDTNPIYLFSKGTIESSNPPSPSIDNSIDADLREQVDGSLALPATFITVMARAQLAIQISESAVDETRVCERLVHEQHLQHQGWAAVVANLEEISSTYRAKAANFEQHFRSYLMDREFYINLLTSFDDDLKLLGRIPLLNPLRGLPGNVEYKTGDPPTEGDAAENQMSLLDWIGSKDHQSSLELVAEQCSKGLEQFNENVFDMVCTDIRQVIGLLDNESMKEIKGLEERLFGLERLMVTAKRNVQSQAEMSEAIHINQSRASDLKDPSILPDLCNSHRQQLMLMLKNHTELRDIHRKCVRAKQELSNNLHSRLRWIMFVERTMCEVDGRMVIYHENLKKLKRHLEIAQQIHIAPRVYLLSIVEVVRRRNFSKSFLKWAQEVSSKASTVYEEEVTTRKKFANTVNGHFLFSLFPGLDEYPPPYAVHPPATFDGDLPEIVTGDIDYLRTVLPDMADLLTTAFVEAVADTALPLDHPSVPTETTDSRLPGPVARLSVHKRLIASLPSNGAHPPSPTMSSSVQDGFVVTTMDHATHAEEERKGDPSADESEPEDFVSLDSGLATAHVVEPAAITPNTVDVSAIPVAASPPPLLSQPVPMPMPPPPLPSPQPLVSPAATTRPRSMTSSHSGNLLDAPATGGDCPLPARSPGPDDDFLMADFYIDESMPSSYTESNGTSGGGGTGGSYGSRFVNGAARAAHHAAMMAELQRNLDERVAQLQDEATQNRQRVLELRDTVRLIQVRHTEALQQMRDELDQARNVVRYYGDKLIEPDGVLTKFANLVKEFEQRVEQRVCQEKDKHVEAALADAQTNHTAITEKLIQKLVLESRQLDKALMRNQELKDELRAREVDMENLRVELTRRLAEQKSTSDELLYEFKKMTLELELELGSVKEECGESMALNEQQLQQAQEDLSRTRVELDQLRSEHSCLEKTLTERSQREKEELQERLESDFLSREVAAAEMARREAEQEADQRVLTACDELKRATSIAWEERLAQKEQEREHDIGRERDLAVQEAREALLKEHKHEMDGLRARFRLAFNTSQVMERSPSDSSLEKIERPDSAEPCRADQVASLRAELQDRDNCIAEMRRRHHAAAEELRLQCEQFREESLRAMRTSLTAEKQVVFNEAINKATADKDRQIAELRAELVAIRSSIQNLPSSSPSPSFDYVGTVRGTASSPSDFFHFISPTSPPKGETEPSTTTNPDSLSASVLAASFSQSVMEQEQAVKDKGDDQGSLEQNVMAMSAPLVPVFANLPEKVSVMTCNVGDLVLFCFNEKYENYLVFSVTTTYYFLHTDCIDALSLIPEPRATRRPWVLAVVVEKEYCQARREPNRFHVPMGMRFYRVRAKPWTREFPTGKSNRMSASVKPLSRQDDSRLGSDSI